MPRLRVAHLRYLVPFIAVAWRSGMPLDDNSFLWHVRAGTHQLDLGRVLTTDPFSFTEAGSAWRTQSWLAELAYGWLEQATGGIGWVPTMKVVAISLAIGLVGLVVYRVSNRHHWVTLGALLLLLWQAAPFGVSRPALLGFTLLGLVVAFTHMDRRPLWILPLVFWLWASVHGMFVVGLGLVFLDALRRRSKRQIGAVVASGLATLLTAHGIGAWLILVQFFQNSAALDLMSEWRPPDFSNPFLLPLALVIVGVLVAGALGRLVPSDLWILIPFVLFGLLAERNVWPAAMVLVPIAVRCLPAQGLDENPPRAEAVVLNWALALVLGLVAVAGVARPVKLDEERFPPREAIAVLDDGPLFHGTAVGGYLIYSEWPEREVFIDDRAELYGEEGLLRFHDLKSGVDVVETFEDLGIEQVLVSADWPIVDFLEILEWQTLHEGEYFVVMAR